MADTTLFIAGFIPLLLGGLFDKQRLIAALHAGSAGVTIGGMRINSIHNLTAEQRAWLRERVGREVTFLFNLRAKQWGFFRDTDTQEFICATSQAYAACLRLKWAVDSAGRPSDVNAAAEVADWLGDGI